MKINYDLAVIKKANSLIEASYKLSVNEQKLILMLTSSIKMEDKDFQIYTMPIKDLAKVLKLKSCNLYDRVPDLIDGLLQKTLTLKRTVYVKNKPRERTLKTNWLSSAEYLHGEGKVELCFDPKLKPYLLNLNKRFTTYKFDEITQLKSNASIRIYELLKQFEKIGNRSFELDELKAHLGLSKDQYLPYYNFKVRILLVAQKELKAKTNITFELEEIKVGRKIGKINFIIKSQACQQVAQLNFADISDIRDIAGEATDGDKLLELLPPKYQDQAAIKQLLSKYLEQYDFDYVSRNIEYANEKSNAIQPGRNLLKKSNYRNYLKKSLENDFGLAFKDDRAEQEELLKNQQQAELAEKAKRESEKQAKEQLENMNAAIKQHMDTLSAAAIKALEIEAIEQLDATLKERVLKKKTGWKINLKLKI